MAIIRWDPFRDMMTLREKMNRLFEDAVASRGDERDMVTGTWSPSVDIYEIDNELILSAEIPGVDEKDVEISIEDNVLTLTGKREFEKETKEENYHRIERAYGNFVRSFTLPQYVDQENVKANHQNGILKIHMPKKPELKPRKVKILKPQQADKK